MQAEEASQEGRKVGAGAGVFAKRVADLTREVALLRKAMVILLTDLNNVGDLSLRAARELEKLLGEGGE